jgi:hypothetical protein
MRVLIVVVKRSNSAVYVMDWASLKGINMSDRVVLCSKCGKTTTEDDAFLIGNDDVVSYWVCKECLVIQEAMAGLNYAPEHRDIPIEAGVKHDQSKLRVDLIPPELISYDAAIYTIGAGKYGDDNWKGGLSYRRVLGAIGRHLLQRCLGEKNDSESGLPHLAHARWNIGALLYYDLHDNKYKTFDDITTECSEALNLFKNMEK